TSGGHRSNDEAVSRLTRRWSGRAGDRLIMLEHCVRPAAQRSVVRPQKRVAAIELKTSLSAPACLARLRGVAGSDDWFLPPWPWLNDPMLVRVRGNRFRLMKAAGGPARNSFRRMFHGQVLEHSQGAVIRGRFKLHAFVRFFLFVWFGGVIGVGLMLLAANAGRALGMP